MKQQRLARLGQCRLSTPGVVNQDTHQARNSAFFFTRKKAPSLAKRLVGRRRTWCGAGGGSTNAQDATPRCFLVAATICRSRLEDCRGGERCLFPVVVLD